MSTQTETQNHTAQLNKTRVAVVLVIAVLSFALGVISSRGVATGLSVVGHGLQSAAHWLDSRLDSPAAYQSGAALEAHERGDDPYLFSQAEKARLKGRKK